MDVLPDLPFELMLSYLSLQERLKSRVVSRRWRNTIDSIRVEHLCFSNNPNRFFLGKNRLITGVFAQNFIGTTRYSTFFNPFSKTILTDLKFLRLGHLYLNEKSASRFAQKLQSFGQLEELSIVHLLNQGKASLEWALNLQMLSSIQLEDVKGLRKLTLDAPKLKKVQLLRCTLTQLHFVHAEPVEKLIIDSWAYTDVKKLKNLEYLYCSDDSRAVTPTLLANLQQLKELHLGGREHLAQFFEEKQEYGRPDVKIYLLGLLLSGPKDPNRFHYYNTFDYLVENHCRLADEIAFWTSTKSDADLLEYENIQRVPVKSAYDLLKRFINLNQLSIDEPVQDIPRFLDLLKHLDARVELRFLKHQPQELFDRLPGYCTAHRLTIYSPPSDLKFLFRLKHLAYLEIHWTSDTEMVEKIPPGFEELELVSWFVFKCSNNKKVAIYTDRLKQISVLHASCVTRVSDRNAAIQFIKKLEEDIDGKSITVVG